MLPDETKRSNLEIIVNQIKDLEGTNHEAPNPQEILPSPLVVEETGGYPKVPAPESLPPGREGKSIKDLCSAPSSVLLPGTSPFLEGIPVGQKDKLDRTRIEESESTDSSLLASNLNKTDASVNHCFPKKITSSTEKAVGVEAFEENGKFSVLKDRDPSLTSYTVDVSRRNAESSVEENEYLSTTFSHLVKGGENGNIQSKGKSLIDVS